MVSWMDDRWIEANGDGVVLSKETRRDPDIFTSSPGPAETYQVYPDSDSTMISGFAAPGGAIEFRIGLKTFFTAPTFVAETPNYSTTFPARYAVVLITYGEGKWRRIFLRQGEGPDYVMRPQDAVNSGGMTGSGPNARPLAKRFSPYNLKDASHRYLDGTNNPGFFTINGATWVNYPTMGGYLFSFNWRGNSGNANVYGAPPINGFKAQPINAGWSVVNYWSSLTAETCPANYRRPIDGVTNAAGAATVVGSEVRQSLWLNPQSGQTSASNNMNSIGGIYADGYYDRGVIDLTGTGVNSAGKYSVYYNNSQFSPNPTPGQGTSAVPVHERLFVASSGRLFYNPETNASLFFPALGISTATNELTIALVGESGAYWTSTAYGTGATNGLGSFLNFSIWDNQGGSPVVVRMNSVLGVSHMSVRCVRIVN